MPVVQLLIDAVWPLPLPQAPPPLPPPPPLLQVGRHLPAPCLGYVMGKRLFHLLTLQHQLSSYEE